jgi:hypothetical protein
MKRSSNTGKGVRIQEKEFEYRKIINSKGFRIQEKKFDTGK